MIDVMSFASGVVAIAIGALAVCVAVFTLTTRSAIASALGLVAMHGMLVALLMALGCRQAALAAAAIGLGFYPALHFAALLLCPPAAKGKRSRPPWATFASAAGAALLLFWAVAMNGGGGAHDVATANESASIAFLFAPLLLVLCAVCLNLLGFGERGALAAPQISDVGP